MKTKTVEITLYSYKAWWFNPKTQEKELTSYSSKFETIEAASKWYVDFGIPLEKRFKRKLIPSETTAIRKIPVTK